MTFDADGGAILQAIILGVGIENDVIVLDASRQRRIAAVTGRQAIHSPNSLAQEA
jgi:hypothetical protein